jgi:hypothetical protein
VLNRVKEAVAKAKPGELIYTTAGWNIGAPRSTLG